MWMWIGAALAGEPYAYVEAGGRWTKWAQNDTFGTMSGVVTSGSEDYTGTSLYSAYEVDMTIDPALYRRVDASVGVANKWYVGLLVEDDETWKDLRRLAVRAGFREAHLLLETGDVAGTLSYGDGHEHPENFTMKRDTFEGRYTNAAIAWGDGISFGVGGVAYQFPTDVGLYNTSKGAVVIDTEASFYILGLYTQFNQVKGCVIDPRLCDEDLFGLVTDLDPLYMGWTVVELGQTAGLALAQPSSGIRTSKTTPDMFAGMGVAGTVSSRVWMARSDERWGGGLYAGVELRQHMFILAGSDNATPPAIGGTKLTMGIPFHVFWGPTFGAAARF